MNGVSQKTKQARDESQNADAGVYFEEPAGAEVADAAALSEHIVPPNPLSGFAIKAGFILAFLWLALSVAAIYLLVVNDGAVHLDLVQWAAIVAAICAPLALIGAAVVLALRLDAVRGATIVGHAQALFENASIDMRAEVAALRAVMAAMHADIRANQEEVDRQAQRLLTVSDGFSRQMSEQAGQLSEETARITKATQALDSAAAAAKADFGTMLADLPRVEALAQSVGAAFRAAGTDAEDQASRIEAGIGRLGKEAAATQEATALATQTLATQIAQIELTSERVHTQLQDMAARLEETVDKALDRTAKALETTRNGVNIQSEALLETVEAARSSLVGTGADAVRNLAESIRQLSAQLTGLNELIDGQDGRVRNLASDLGQGISDVEQKLAALAGTSEERSAELINAIGRVRGELDAIALPLDEHGNNAGKLIERVTELQTMLADVNTMAEARLPENLANASSVVASTRDALAQVQAEIGTLDSGLDALRHSATDIQQLSGDNINSLDKALAEAVSRVSALTERLEDSQTRLKAIESDADDVGFKASSTLLDAITRAREAAGQAAEHIRGVFANVSEEAHNALAAANDETLKSAIDAAIGERIAALKETSEQAVAAAQTASERLARQMLTIADTASTIEARASEVSAQVEQQNQEDFSRQSALLIESLNSAAIDVAKILSNEVTDVAWAAYLKGDRSVFARRAVRLLEAGEAKAILRQYEQEPEFREQVNRYVHDFEAIIRRVLSERDGGPMAVAMLSSDVGKLYVAMAQAIDRLRTA